LFLESTARPHRTLLDKNTNRLCGELDNKWMAQRKPLPHKLSDRNGQLKTQWLSNESNRINGFFDGCACVSLDGLDGLDGRVWMGVKCIYFK